MSKLFRVIAIQTNKYETIVEAEDVDEAYIKAEKLGFAKAVLWDSEAEIYDVREWTNELSLLSMEDLKKAYPNVNWKAAARIFKLSEHK